MSVSSANTHLSARVRACAYKMHFTVLLLVMFIYLFIYLYIMYLFMDVEVGRVE